MLAMMPLMVAVAIDVYLIAHAILHRQLPAAAVATLIFFVFAIVWFVIPQVAIWRTSSSRRH
jgi:hypothetical protein